VKPLRGASGRAGLALAALARRCRCGSDGVLRPYPAVRHRRAV